MKNRQFNGREPLLVGVTGGIELEAPQMVAGQGGAVIVMGNRAEKAEAVPFHYEFRTVIEPLVCMPAKICSVVLRRQ
ncbi:hypothetical protein CO663_08560 [Rhizobium anhuiense]|uniref:hypothetical protein n=1 Tax=Rhizobium anhuiense TaxID=1184720 RepID=UPI000BE9C6B6|nr:hypothetical protein [Rhizobium anhuiense]PDS59981.1 hypothetical protein CO663_08560 [Rhizobium anhuiense]